MPFDLQVSVIDEFTKIEVTEVDQEGDPKPGRKWYVNIPACDPDNVPEDVIEDAMENLMQQRAATIAKEAANAAMTTTISGMIDL